MHKVGARILRAIAIATNTIALLKDKPDRTANEDMALQKAQRQLAMTPSRKERRALEAVERSGRPPRFKQLGGSGKPIRV